MERTTSVKTAMDAVNAYVEYRRIVGEDDGGRLFSEAEYEEYKRKVMPARMHNRLYVSFGVPGKIDCKLIGPETPCFCSHRYKQHQTDFEKLPTQRPIALPCRVKGCRCGSYQYVHCNGSQAVRCRCKHSPSEHSEAADHLCRKCNTCTGFQSPYSCGCGHPGHAHETLVESREEREARGLPVGREVPYAAMGGLTGFSSLIEGYLRLDPSGSGLSSHDGLRPNRAEQHEEPEGAYGPLSGTSVTEAESLKGPGEDDVGYPHLRGATKPGSGTGRNPNMKCCQRKPVDHSLGLQEKEFKKVD